MDSTNEPSCYWSTTVLVSNVSNLCASVSVSFLLQVSALANCMVGWLCGCVVLRLVQEDEVRGGFWAFPVIEIDKSNSLIFVPAQVQISLCIP